LGGPIWTNQMYQIGITNNLGFSFWNSYSNNYPTNYIGSLNMQVFVGDITQMTLSNSDWAAPYSFTFATNFLYAPSIWPGSKWTAKTAVGPANNSFIATNWANAFVPLEVYKTGAKIFAPTNDSDPFETNVHPANPLPQFNLTTTNWVQGIILDNGQIVDYVQ